MKAPRILGHTLGLLAITALLLPAPASSTARENGRCEGAWILHAEGPPGLQTLVGVATLTRTGPSGQRLAFFAAPVNPLRPLGPDLFANTDSVSPSVGLAQRRAKNVYGLRWISYGVNMPPIGTFDRGEVQYILMIDSEIRCGTDTMTETGMVSVYSAKVSGPLLDQDDAPEDGLPDAGELPIAEVPFEFIYRRLP